MLEIALVADEHDDDALVGMVPQLLQPPRHVGVRRLLGNVVHQQGTDRASVVSGGGEMGKRVGRLAREASQRLWLPEERPKLTLK